MNYYRQVRVMEQQEPENPPLYDSDMGKSTEVTSPNNSDDKMLADTELVNQLYSQLNKILYPFIIKVLDGYDYNNSPIYDEDGITKETLAQLTAQVLDEAADVYDDIDEIRLEVNTRQIVAGWNRSSILNSVVESLILNNIFMYRRPRRRIIYNNYSFKDGQYNGLNYS